MPERIWAAADVTSAGPQYDGGEWGDIEGCGHAYVREDAHLAALAAERERAARIAEGGAASWRRGAADISTLLDEDTHERFLARADTAESIAAAIRGDQP